MHPFERLPNLSKKVGQTNKEKAIFCLVFEASFRHVLGCYSSVCVFVQCSSSSGAKMWKLDFVGSLWKASSLFDMYGNSIWKLLCVCVCACVRKACSILVCQNVWQNHYSKLEKFICFLDGMWAISSSSWWPAALWPSYCPWSSSRNSPAFPRDCRELLFSWQATKCSIRWWPSLTFLHCSLVSFFPW